MSTGSNSVVTGDGAQDQEGTRNPVSRPLIMPEAYNGDQSTRWDQWIAHFDSVAQINGWNEGTKLLWLQVRLTGKAQTAWERLNQDAKSTYENAKIALRERFEPSCKQDLYAAEFHARKHLDKESWGDLADNLHSLADRAFPDLDDKAREQLSLSRFLSLIDKPTIALSVRQRRPKNLNEAATYTLEAETHLSLTPGLKVAAVTSSSDNVDANIKDGNHASIATIQARQDAVVELLKSLSLRMEHLENTIASHVEYKSRDKSSLPYLPPTANTSKKQEATGPRQPIICRKCGVEGHYARGCATGRTSGN